MFLMILSSQTGKRDRVRLRRHTDGFKAVAAAKHTENVEKSENTTQAPKTLISERSTISGYGYIIKRYRQETPDRAGLQVDRY